MIKNKDISLWKNCQNLTEDEIKSCDKLNFLAKSQKYIENYLLDEDFESRGWMHFITGFWGSGKTSFINCILWQLKNSNFQFIKDKKVLPIFFNPWNLQSTKNIYEHFLDVLSSALLQGKYDKKLKIYTKDLLSILDKSGNSWLTILSHLFSSTVENLDDTLSWIAQSISETYKDFYIVVVIDEIDRLGKEYLVNVWKILNLLSKIIWLTENKNFICLYAADSRHLYSFSFSDNEQIGTPLNFYQYFKKFSATKYDVYNTTKQEIVNYIITNVPKQDGNKKKSIEDFTWRIFQSIQLELEQLGIAITMRDINFLMKQIAYLQNNVKKKLAAKFDDQYLELLMPLNSYIIWFIDEKLFSPMFYGHLIYFLSLFEKDPDLKYLLNHLALQIAYILKHLPSSEYQQQESELIAKYLKRFEVKWIRFSYMWNTSDWYYEDNIQEKVTKFIKSDFLFIKDILEEEKLYERLEYIEDSFQKKVADDLSDGLLKVNQKNWEYLFSYPETIADTNNIFFIPHTRLNRMLWYIRDKYDIQKAVDFLESIIKFIPILINKQQFRSWREIKHIIDEVTSAFAWVYHNIQTNSDDWKNKLSLDSLLNLIKNFSDDPSTIFVALVFYLYFYGLSIVKNSWYHSFNDKIKFLLDRKECFNDKSYLWLTIKTESAHSLFFWSKLLETLEAIIKQANDQPLDLLIDNFLASLPSDNSNDVDNSEESNKEIQKIQFISRLIYCIFEEGIVELDSNGESILNFIDHYISEKGQFLLLCTSLEYQGRYWSKYTMSIQRENRTKLSKLIYKNLHEKYKNIDGTLEDYLIKKYWDKAIVLFSYKSIISFHTLDFILKDTWIEKEVFMDELKKGLQYFA